MIFALLLQRRPKPLNVDPKTARPLPPNRSVAEEVYANVHRAPVREVPVIDGYLDEEVESVSLALGAKEVAGVGDPISTHVQAPQDQVGFGRIVLSRDLREFKRKDDAIIQVDCFALYQQPVRSTEKQALMECEFFLEDFFIHCKLTCDPQATLSAPIRNAPKSFPSSRRSSCTGRGDRAEGDSRRLTRCAHAASWRRDGTPRM